MTVFLPDRELCSVQAQSNQLSQEVTEVTSFAPYTKVQEDANNNHCIEHSHQASSKRKILCGNLFMCCLHELQGPWRTSRILLKRLAGADSSTQLKYTNPLILHDISEVRKGRSRFFFIV